MKKVYYEVIDKYSGDRYLTFWIPKKNKDALEKVYPKIREGDLFKDLREALKNFGGEVIDIKELLT